MYFYVFNRFYITFSRLFYGFLTQSLTYEKHDTFQIKRKTH